MGLIGIVQNDIKRVVAYSTLSQLGYMTVALGVSAYSAAVFHLMTHAFFKALLFLAAGSVIMGMHHEQDIRKMIAYWAVLLGVFVTAFYSFRLFFLVFHGEERFDDHTREHLHESPKVVTWPLMALAVPSVLIGGMTVSSMPFGEFFSGVITVLPEHDTLAAVKEHFHGPISFALHAVQTIPFWLAMAGVATAYVFYMVSPSIPEALDKKFGFLRRILDNKYGFDDFNQAVFAGGSVALGRSLWKVGDQTIIDGALVNGSAKGVGLFSHLARGAQTGYLYHYAFAMIIGLLALMTVFLFLI